MSTLLSNVAPIDTLPVEILIHIAGLVKENDMTNVFGRKMVWMRLLRVSTRWYATLTSAPLLWTRLFFYGNAPTDVIAPCIRRSGEVKDIEVTFDIGYVNRAYDKLSELCVDGNVHVHRLKSLAIYWPMSLRGEVAMFLEERFRADSLTSLTLLEDIDPDESDLDYDDLYTSESDEEYDSRIENMEDLKEGDEESRVTHESEADEGALDSGVASPDEEGKILPYGKINLAGANGWLNVHRGVSDADSTVASFTGASPIVNLSGLHSLERLHVSGLLVALPPSAKATVIEMTVHDTAREEDDTADDDVDNWLLDLLSGCTNLERLILQDTILPWDETGRLIVLPSLRHLNIMEFGPGKIQELLDRFQSPFPLLRTVHLRTALRHTEWDWDPDMDYVFFNVLPIASPPALNPVDRTTKVLYRAEQDFFSLVGNAPRAEDGGQEEGVEWTIHTDCSTFSQHEQETLAIFAFLELPAYLDSNLLIDLELHLSHKLAPDGLAPNLFGNRWESYAVFCEFNHLRRLVIGSGYAASQYLEAVRQGAEAAGPSWTCLEELVLCLDQPHLLLSFRAAAAFASRGTLHKPREMVVRVNHWEPMRWILEGKKEFNTRTLMRRRAIRAFEAVDEDVKVVVVEEDCATCQKEQMIWWNTENGHDEDGCVGALCEKIDELLWPRDEQIDEGERTGEDEDRDEETGLTECGAGEPSDPDGVPSSSSDDSSASSDSSSDTLDDESSDYSEDDSEDGA